MLRDLRHAIRGFRRAGGFAAAAVLCLALGIGLNTTIFSIVDGVLLKPLPYEQPDRLMHVVSVNPRIGVTQGGMSYADVRDLTAASSAVAGMAGLRGQSVTLTDSETPERFLSAGISWNLFELLGVRPQMGPGFRAEHEQPHAEPVAILSDAVWRLRYAADPDIIGRAIAIDGVPATVVGVMPPRFEFPEATKLWVPLTRFTDPLNRGDRGLFVVGRLAPGASVDTARSDLAAHAARLAGQFPSTNRDWSVSALRLRETFIPDDVTLVLWLMMAGATLVLFIACSNVANLLLARASSRRREIAVRAALGADRGRIVRQLLVEGVVLALAAVPLGILLAIIGTRMIYGAMPVEGVPYYITWAVDARSVAWAVTVAVGTALLFGLFPALQVTRVGLHDDLKEGTRGNSPRRALLRSGLVVAQVALAVVSLVGALLFVRTFANLDSFNLGFDSRPLMTMRIAMSGEPYEVEGARARRVQDILERVEALPGVEAAFASNLVPLQGGGFGAAIVVDGRPAEPGAEPGISFPGVTPHFFRTLGVAPAEGRDFTDAEGWSRSGVAIVNRTMAERFWPGRSAVGGRFRIAGDGAAAEEWFTVVGVIEDVKQDDVDPDDEPFAAAYRSYAYQQSLNTGLTIRVRDGDPTAVATPVRDAIRASDPHLPIFQVATMEELRRLGYWEFGIFGWIFGAIGIGGLVLAAIGVYGVLAYSVSQRVQEIGVRVALGATRRDVMRLIVGHGLALAGIGVVVGMALAPVGTWAARSFFYQVSPFDPVTFAAVAVFLLAVAAAASALPALRATRIDPLEALRQE